ncbi:hypothetical protein [Enterobacter sp. 638]|uniref:hypothetical protein n=1 Tax=Enterobacter sp. (strain 638) TaxID=399742 RepID=UPI0005A2A7EB|nr:hypothetical protein [Enterobacter sp. 638]
MASKLIQRRTRRLKSDVAWWMAEAADSKQIAMEHALEIERLRALVIRVPMPVIVPRDMAHQLYHTETKRCRTCNDGLRGGCSSCVFNKQ